MTGFFCKWVISFNLSMYPRICFLSAMILLCMGGMLPAQSGHPAPFRVGAASASVTPEAPAWLAGYSGAGLSVGVHDSLYAKAVAVSAGNETVVLLTVDCIGMLRTELESIRRKVAVRLPMHEFDPARIVLSSTHTHCGPDIVGLWGPGRFRSGVQKDYRERLTDIAADQVVRALAARRPAWLMHATATYGDGWVVNRSIPEELDRSVTALRFADEAGRSIATLTNFACHPTVIGRERKLISSDWVAGHYRYLDSAMGGVNLFLQGCIGGWVQPVGPDAFDFADARGAGLGASVLTALERGQSDTLGGIDYRRRVFRMSVQSAGFRLLSMLGVIDRRIGRKVTTEIAAFRIGPARFVTHPGESSPFYGLESKRLMAGEGPKLVLGLGMDAMGYLLKPEFFDKSRKIPHADYLTMVSVGAKGGPEMMDVVRELITSLNR
jgi:hypothetical protein